MVDDLTDRNGCQRILTVGALCNRITFKAGRSTNCGLVHVTMCRLCGEELGVLHTFEFAAVHHGIVSR